MSRARTRMATINDPARQAPTRNAQPGQPPERQSASDERKLREERILDAATTLLVRWGYRITTHGMLAALSNPLMAAIIRGKSDIFNGFLGAYDPGFLNQLVGDADAYFVQLQQAGLIRADIPASIITYLLTALKVGMINSP